MKYLATYDAAELMLRHVQIVKPIDWLYRLTVLLGEQDREIRPGKARGADQH